MNIQFEVGIIPIKANSSKDGDAKPRVFAVESLKDSRVTEGRCSTVKEEHLYLLAGEVFSFYIQEGGNQLH